MHTHTHILTLTHTHTHITHTHTHTHTHTLTLTLTGALLSAKANADGELHTARKEARRVIHALHKSQEKNDTIEVCS